MAGTRKKLSIEWTKTAENQLFIILAYWTERTKSTSYAEKLADVVWKRTEFISKNPMASIKTKFPSTRKAALGHFSIFYKVTDTNILITAFWDNRQDPKKLYELLKDM